MSFSFPLTPFNQFARVVIQNNPRLRKWVGHQRDLKKPGIFAFAFAQLSEPGLLIGFEFIEDAVNSVAPLIGADLPIADNRD